MNFLNNINWRNGQAIHPIERNLILLNDGRGLTNQQIAQEINRHPRTVQRRLTKFHETGLMEKKRILDVRVKQILMMMLISV
jgi:predicted transcriptional regulator